MTDEDKTVQHFNPTTENLQKLADKSEEAFQAAQPDEDDPCCEDPESCPCSK